VGDLSTLLLGLERLVSNKPTNEPLVINLSLGFLPHPARLPAAWYGLRRPHDRDYVHSEELFDAQHERALGSSQPRPCRPHRRPAARLACRSWAHTLSLNNCLVIAAAGNDFPGAGRGTRGAHGATVAGALRDGAWRGRHEQ